MSGFSVFTTDFSGLNSNVPDASTIVAVNIPELKVGDICLFHWRHGNESNPPDLGFFASVVTVDGELKQQNFQDLSANTYTAVFLRFT